ncbi:hypothetical protein G7Y89_g3585 [Cudoniella acicularis]|uniref:Uncharacterized protein n=1 Tax=Cudoniella acicularis TaxID=354080 RepID=A0A8H4RSE4_9HELO|nr:hypothetical protein G7Y89_g3585 [Cudoniella acicularis]
MSIDKVNGIGSSIPPRGTRNEESLAKVKSRDLGAETRVSAQPLARQKRGRKFTGYFWFLGDLLLYVQFLSNFPTKPALVWGVYFLALVLTAHTAVTALYLVKTLKVEILEKMGKGFPRQAQLGN